MSLDLSKDYLFIDGTVNVSYFVTTGSGTYQTPIAVSYSLRRIVDKEILEMMGLLDVTTTYFHVWKDYLNGNVPKNEDVIQDTAYNRWTVKHVETMDDGQRYRLLCTKELGTVGSTPV